MGGILKHVAVALANTQLNPQLSAAVDNQAPSAPVRAQLAVRDTNISSSGYDYVDPLIGTSNGGQCST